MNPLLHRLLLAVVGLSCTTGSAAQSPESLDQLQTLLRTQALTPPDEVALQALGRGDLNNILQLIDPWASWSSISAHETLPAPAGIGAELFTEAGRFWLLPYADGPLFRAGVVDRVQLLVVNGRTVAEMNLTDVVQAISGIDGAVVELLICDNVDCLMPRALLLVLEQLRKPSVETITIDDRRLFRLRHFSARETRVVLQTLIAREPVATQLLLDLRDCQGGDLYEAMDTAALFIPTGETLTKTYDRNGLKQHYRSPPGSKFMHPLTLLISSSTASAGELFAGILQSHGRARLVGTGSRGKCVSQTERQLADGSLLRFTNLEVVLPGDRHCHGSGVQPDLLVSADEVHATRPLLQRLQNGNAQLN